MKKQKYTMPKFLKKADYSAFDFEFKKNQFLQDNQKFKQELLLVHGEKNTIILLDGSIIYKNIDGVQVSSAKNKKVVVDYKRKQNTNYFLQENKKHLSSVLVLESKDKGKKTKVNVVYGVSKQLYHATFVLADKNADFEVYEKFVCKNHAKLNYVLEISARENAHIKYNCFQKMSADNSQVFTFNLNAGKHSSILFNNINLNKSNTINLVYGNLLGQGASINADGCAFASDKTNHKNLVLLHHKEKHTNSKINYAAVVNGFASVEIDGCGKIDEGQSKSDAQQESKVILLADTAKVVVNPQLLISEFDVSAGHAAGVGGLDEQQIYYLQSRGLTREKAFKLLLLAFAENFLNKLSAKEKAEAIRLIKKRIK